MKTPSRNNPMYHKLLCALCYFVIVTLSPAQNNQFQIQQQRMQEQQRLQDQQQRIRQQQIDQERRAEQQRRLEQQRQEMMRQREAQMAQQQALRQQQMQQQQLRQQQLAERRQTMPTQRPTQPLNGSGPAAPLPRQNIVSGLFTQKASVGANSSQQPGSVTQQQRAALPKTSREIQRAKAIALPSSSVLPSARSNSQITPSRTAQLGQRSQPPPARARILEPQKKTNLTQTKQVKLPDTVLAISTRLKNSGRRNSAPTQPRICFVAGTLIKTVHGFVPIEQIQSGDIVWSRDELSGAEGWKPVGELFMTHPTELIHLSYVSSGQSKSRTLTGTAVHPFWSLDRDIWVDMADLTIGERLSLDERESHATVVSLEREIAPKGEFFTTYNFEVLGWSTYFVAPKNSPPDTTSVWVHNQNAGFCNAALVRIEKTAQAKGAGIAERVLSRFSQKLPPDQLAHLRRIVAAEKVSVQGFDPRKIIETPKGSRPDPSTYLKTDYIIRHRELFSDGSARIQREKPTGVIGRTETWVMPMATAREMIKRANGNVRKLEHLLGLERGELGSNPVLVEIPRPKGYRIPSGNEFGANTYWVPGGFTKRNIPEAIIDPVESDAYTTHDIEVTKHE
jgi:hypothetical protein